MNLDEVIWPEAGFLPVTPANMFVGNVISGLQAISASMIIVTQSIGHLS